MPSHRLNSLVDRLGRRVIIVRRKRPGCIEAVRRAFPIYRLNLLLFLGNTLWTHCRASAPYLARSLPKSRQNKRVEQGKSGLLGDCGEGKLWGRHPLTF